MTRTPTHTLGPVNGRPVVEYRGHDKTHTHGLGSVVGYVVRETIRDGKILTVDGRCGVDVGSVDGATHYADTFALRDSYRSLATAGYAVVDMLYRCGCRSNG